MTQARSKCPNKKSEPTRCPSGCIAKSILLQPKVGLLICDPLASAAELQEFAAIETGGENHEDPYDRLRSLMRELQQPAN